MAKTAINAGKITFNSVDYGIVSMTVDQAVDEVDVTDGEDTAGTTEFTGGRTVSSVSFTLVKDLGTTDLTLGTEYALTADFDGLSYAGDVVLFSKSAGAQLRGRMEVSYTGKFNGTVTTTPVS